MFGRGGVIIFTFVLLSAISYGEKEEKKTISDSTTDFSENIEKDRILNDGGPTVPISATVSGKKGGFDPGQAAPANRDEAMERLNQAFAYYQKLNTQESLDAYIALKQKLAASFDLASATPPKPPLDTSTGGASSQAIPSTANTGTGGPFGNTPVVAAPPTPANANPNAQDLLGGATPVASQINQIAPVNRPQEAAIAQLNGAKPPVAGDQQPLQTGGGINPFANNEVIERTHRSNMDTIADTTKAQASAFDPNNGASIDPIPTKNSKKIEQQIAKATQALQLAEKSGNDRALTKELDTLETLATQTEDPISDDLRNRVLASVSRVQGRLLNRISEQKESYSDSSSGAISAAPFVPRTASSSGSAQKMEDTTSLLKQALTTQGGTELATMSAKALLTGEIAPQMGDKAAAISAATAGKPSPGFAIFDVPTVVKSRGLAAKLLNRVVALLERRDQDSTTTKAKPGSRVKADKFKLPTVIASFFSAGSASEEKTEPFRFQEDSWGALLLLAAIMSFFPSLAILFMVNRKLRRISQQSRTA